MTVEQLFDTLNPPTDVVLPPPYLRTPVFPGLVTPEECERIIAHAETYAALKGGWDTTRHRNYPTVDLDTRSIPSIRSLVWEITTKRVFPRMENEFNLAPGSLVLNEAFVVKYTPWGQRMLDAHRDHSELSFVVALNDDYEGGGTHFLHSNITVKPSKGSVVLFAGKHMHQGMEVLEGARYILAGFIFLASLDRRVETMLDACAQGDEPMVRWLIEQVDPGLVHAQKDGSLETPLIEAAYNGHLQIAEYLLYRGALVNQQYQDGFTALYLAAQEGRADVVDLMLRHGANHLLGLHKGSGKTTPLQIAAKKGHTTVVNRLIQHDPSLHHLNKCTTQEHSALWFACSQEQMETAHVLISHGANFSADTFNSTLGQLPEPVRNTQGHDLRVVICKAMQREEKERGEEKENRA